MSDTVVSVSCPVALTTGILLAKIALATISSLKGHRSSRDPPPLAIMTVSISGSPASLSSAATTEGAALSPCTNAGARTSSTRGYRRPMTFCMSCQTEPDGDVTTPTLRGNTATGRLRDFSKNPSFSSLSCNSSSLSCTHQHPAAGLSQRRAEGHLAPRRKRPEHARSP